MTTERDEHASSDRCAIPSCRERTGGGFFCEKHRPGEPPERLETRVRRCGVIRECFRHPPAESAGPRHAVSLDAAIDDAVRAWNRERIVKLPFGAQVDLFHRFPKVGDAMAIWLNQRVYIARAMGRLPEVRVGGAPLTWREIDRCTTAIRAAKLRPKKRKWWA